MSTLVLGIGNTLLSDEGVGVHVVRHLATHHQDLPDVELLDGGTLSFTLAEAIARHQSLLVVDAARLGEPPGAVRCLEGEAMERYLAGSRGSVHEVGLSDLFDIARLSDTLPPQRALIGIQPAHIGWGEAPSAPVAAAIPVAARQALELLRRWASHAT